MKKKILISIFSIIFIIIILSIYFIHHNTNSTQLHKNIPVINKVLNDDNIIICENVDIHGYLEEDTFNYLIKSTSDLGTLPFEFSLPDYTLDDDFFMEHNLVLYCAILNSSSNNLKCDSYKTTDSDLYLKIDIEAASIGTCDIAFKVLPIITDKSIETVYMQK